MNKYQGQSVLEYLIVLTCIIAAVAVAIRTGYTNALKENYTKSGDYLTTETQKLPDSLN